MQALYYPDDGTVAADPELRAWWTEIRTRGHPDADPAGWPVEDIATQAQLADVVTTIVWVCAGMHAAGLLFRALPSSWGESALAVLASCRHDSDTRAHSLRGMLSCPAAVGLITGDQPTTCFV